MLTTGNIVHLLSNSYNENGNNHICMLNIDHIMCSKQEGPRGPRSLTWGKGQESQWSYYKSTTIDAIPNMKALGFVLSDKKIVKRFILKTYLLTPWPTYATNWNSLNNFDRGPSRNYSCLVLSNSHSWFKRRCRLKFSLYNSM